MTKMRLSKFVENAALYALSYEANVTPKPGLVDRNNTGAHEDMTLPMLLSSAEAVAPLIGECAECGFELKGESYEDTFFALQKIGLRAEEAMFKATNGINTHKGAVYAFCLLAGAFGRNLCDAFLTPEVICKTASRLCEKSCMSSLLSASHSPVTHGDEAYKRAHLSGARGEALLGYPGIVKVALPALETALQNGHTENDAGVYALLCLISQTDDTCLFHRGGFEGLLYAKSLAFEALKEDFTKNAGEIDRIFINKRLSPGGCADLLAAAMFIKILTTTKREEYTCE